MDTKVDGSVVEVGEKTQGREKGGSEGGDGGHESGFLEPMELSLLALWRCALA